MKLSNDFNWCEFTASETALKKGIPNTPAPWQKENIERLVLNLLQPVRDLLDIPLTITSGFRSSELNKAVGGSPSSQHCTGEAADLKCENNKLLFDTIRQNFYFDQLIWEFGDDSQPAWVHVSLKEQGNRGEALRAVKEKGKTKYIRL